MCDVIPYTNGWLISAIRFLLFGILYSGISAYICGFGDIIHIVNID